MTEPYTYAETTSAITITVEPFYLDEQSEPSEGHFVWAYHVRIENNGDKTVQLMTRYWRITDSLGHVQEVRGEGVIGEQPHIAPGQTFSYTSGAILETEVGSMRGSYQMIGEDGTHFDAEIPMFPLAVPHALH